MIKLEHLHIEEFRGIRSIDLPLASNSFVVHGPNGSGKSGVVDAIDFALTGNVGRLSGAGTGSVSVARHAPHVNRRDDPASAVVALTIRDVDTDQTAVLTRSVGSPTSFTLDPDTPAMRKSLEQAQDHPELTLSRREIIKYVVSKAADRAREIQALLKLDRLDEFRRLLRTVQGRASTDQKAKAAEVATAEQSFKGHLDINTLLGAEIARVINNQRAILAVNDLTDVTIDTDFLQGIDADAGSQPLDLVSAKRDIKDLLDRTGDEGQESIDAARRDLVEALNKVLDDPGVLDAIKHRAFLEAGLAAIEDEHCPLCGTDWESAQQLSDHVNRELQRSAEAASLRTEILRLAEEYRAKLRELKDSVERAHPLAVKLGPAELPQRLRTWADDLVAHAQILTSIDSLTASHGELTATKHFPPAGLVDELEKLKTAVEDQPDQSAAVAARAFLTVAKERWTRVRLARVAESKAAATLEAAKKIYETYCDVADTALADLYKTVEADFSRYYRLINSDDESAFKAALKPTAGSLDLEVDFYGIGMFPPNAYHSEGHQDGMGVCLYLALMKQLLGDDFKFAILDDVVMSVDVNHRRQFCILLKSEFPDVQFIITTHDEVWARQMQSNGLITSKGQARFYGWSVEDGPLYEQGDVWERIDEDLAKDDVNGAAHKLRRRLEAATADIAEMIGAAVPYRGDANYELGVLLSAVNGRHGDLLKKAATAANSWGDATAQALVQQRKEERSTVVPAQQDEAWAINTLVHNNDWAQMSKSDFAPVLSTSKAYLDLFLCDNADCVGWIHTAGQPLETLRCDCGRYSLNLKPKGSNR